MAVKNPMVKKAGAYQREYVRHGINNVVYLLCGVLVSRGAVFGELAPFGASFASAVPKKYLLSSLIGTAMGYVLLNPSDSFRYLAVVVAIGSLRWLMSDIEKISESRLFAPLVAFCPILATGVALLFARTSSMSSFADCVVEAVLAGAAAYFFSVAVKLAMSGRGICSYSQQETASIVMSGCILILSLGSIAYENVSVGRIIAMLIVLMCARYGSVAGGSISGIATGSVFSIASRQNSYICSGFAFGGLMAGLFAPLGKLGCCIAFVISNSIMSLAFGQNSPLYGVLIESFVSSTIFMILPKEVGNIVSPIFSNENGASLGEALRKNIVMRLDFASKAVANVKKDVTDVSDKLKRIGSVSFDRVCENTEKEVCSNCGLRMYCYENQGGVTRDDFHRLEEFLEANGSITGKDVENVFIKKCCKKGEIASSMNYNYREYLSSLEAQRRVDGVRGVVAGQFSGISDILHDLSQEFKNTMRCDSDSAERVVSALSELGAVVEECVCLVSAGGKMSVEITLSGRSGKRLGRGIIVREVSKCCARRFDLPEISNECGKIRVALSEMPVYDVEIGADQHIADNGKLCGDCLNYFNDGFGNTYALVCDGMGTGGRAAVDGSMAVSVMSRLLRCGLSADSSLQIVNSALMVKSEDESLSTVDVVKLDLFTGKVTLKKAGAPTTFIKKGGRVVTREMPSLPAGILNNIKFTSDTINLTTGDIIVMVSDGVLSGDDKWLEKLIKSWHEGSSQDLAHAVVTEALKRRNETREDDMTALAMIITERE